MGVDVNRVYDRINNLYQGNGTYSYDPQWDFIADYLHATTGLGGNGYADKFFSYSQRFGNPQLSLSTTDFGGYINDDWRVTPKLTITAGLRYEYEYIPLPPGALVNLATQSATTKRPDDRNNFGPRVGFAYNVYGNGNTVLRGGYGLYYVRVINSNIMQAYQNHGSPNGTTSYQTYAAASTSATNPHGGCANLFPSIFASQVNSITLAQLNALGCVTPAGAPYTSTTVTNLTSRASGNNLFTSSTVSSWIRTFRTHRYTKPIFRCSRTSAGRRCSASRT